MTIKQKDLCEYCFYRGIECKEIKDDCLDFKPLCRKVWENDTCLVLEKKASRAQGANVSCFSPGEKE